MIDVEAPKLVTLSSNAIGERAPLAVQEAQEQLRDHPDIIAQVELFYELFRDRSERTFYEGSNGLEEVTQFATRNDACTQIDEIYTVTDTYSPNLKAQQRAYTIDLFVNQTHEKICIAGDQQMKVYRYDQQGQAELLQDDDAEAVLLDYELRALQTENVVTNRTEEERIVADADATQKLDDFHNYLERKMSQAYSPVTDLGRKALHGAYAHPEAWSSH